MSASPSELDQEKRECDVCGRLRVPYAEPAGVPLCSRGCLQTKEKKVELDRQRIYEIQHGVER